MGNCAGNCFDVKKFVSTAMEEIRTAPSGNLEGELHMLVCGIDYSCDRFWAGQNPLDTRPAFEIMLDLGRRCNAATLESLWNEQVTKENVLAAIERVAEEVGEDDYFVFYYTGHGDRLPDQDGDEVSGLDSAFCLLGPDGNVEPRQEVWLRDDLFAETIRENIDPGAKIIVLADCCHSGTILDVTRPEWSDGGFRALSITGCEDSQTAAGTGKGGMFSRALSMAIEDLQTNEEEAGYMTSTLYNWTLWEYQQNKLPSHTQNIAIHGVGIYPHEMPWPLEPEDEYVSPARAYFRSIQLSQGEQ